MPRPCVVMLGGHLCTPALWSRQCDALGATTECIPLSLSDGSSMAELADSVLRRAPATFSLAALSMGGHVAMELMRRAPERVERLALIDTRAGVDSPERMKTRVSDEALVANQGLGALAELLPSRWMLPAHASVPSLHRLVVDMALDTGVVVRQQQLKALVKRIDSRPSLRDVACPTLVMCGRQDMTNPVWMHEEMVGLIPGARLHIVEDCGHLSPVEQPERVSAALRDWLTW